MIFLAAYFGIDSGCLGFFSEGSPGHRRTTVQGPQVAVQSHRDSSLMRKLISFVLTGLVPLITGIPSLDAAEKWVSVRSQNFLLVGNASDFQIRRIARELEEFRAAFGMLFPNAGRKSPIGTTVIVFKDDSAFKPFKPLYEGKPANVAGYFQPGSDVNFIALNGAIEKPAVVYHEFVHSLTNNATQRLPAWVNEGLAEFYSTVETS